MDLLADLLAGRLDEVCLEGGRLRSDGPRPRLLLPGSFNPLHEGHSELARVAAGLLGEPAAFEMAVFNADKPALSESEVRRRLDAFHCREPLWLTRAATFAAKADLFPGAHFVVGADTALRILDPRFYGHSEERLLAALAHFGRQGCHFLVAGRVDAGGSFQTLGHLTVPDPLRDLFFEIPEAAFRRDISSTQLRGTGGS
jgi:hypothetical protein